MTISGPSVESNAAWAISEDPLVPQIRHWMATAPKEMVRGTGCAKSAVEALQVARPLVKNDKWAAALVQLDNGVHRAPTDAKLRSERGNVLLHLGDTSSAIADWITAVGLTTSADLLKTLHYNLGVSYQALGDLERARRYFSSAEARKSEEAHRLLGEASRYRATWTTRPSNGGGPLAYSLRELVSERRFVGCEDVPRVTTEQEAAVLLCRPCHGGSSGFKDECAKPPCQLEFPLKIEDGYMDLHNMVFEAEKLPYKKPVYLYRSYVLDGPSVAEKWRIAADRLIIERNDRAYSDLDDGLGHVVFESPPPLYTADNNGSSDNTQLACRPIIEEDLPAISNGVGTFRTYQSPGETTHEVTVYSIETNQLLLTVKAVDGDVNVEIVGGLAHLVGAGCDDWVSLPRRNAPPRAVDASLVPAAASAVPVATKLAVVIGRERESITNGAQATRIFQVAWIEEVVPTATGKAQRVRDHTDAVLLPGRRPWSAPSHASLGRCRDAGVQTSKMLKDDVLYSAPAALERDGDCWQVTFQEHLDTVVGYLDARTGSLLFVYLEYEG